MADTADINFFDGKTDGGEGYQAGEISLIYVASSGGYGLGSYHRP